MKLATITIVLTFALVTCLFACDKQPETPTRDDCIAYWARRTANWTNPPSADIIATDAVYCGNFN